MEAEVATVHAELMARESFKFDPGHDGEVDNITESESMEDKVRTLTNDGWTDKGGGIWSKAAMAGPAASWRQAAPWHTRTKAATATPHVKGEKEEEEEEEEEA